jgi:hypothetical protein
VRLFHIPFCAIVIVVWLAATIHAQVPTPTPTADSAPAVGDVKIEWDTGYPKKENGKLKLKGKVTFVDPWSSPDGAVLIKLTPTQGGVAIATVITVGNMGVWEDALDLSDFPNSDPKRDYDIVPQASAWKGKGKRPFAVYGPRKTMELP